MNLHVDLQEGFHHDTVEVWVNGKEYFSKKDLNTRYQIGLAEGFDVEVDQGQISVVLRVPNKGLEKKVTLEVAKDTYLGFSISEEGGIKHTVKETPFFYM